MEESMNEPLPVGSCVVLDGLDLRIAERPTMATVLSWISTKCQLVARFGNDIPGFQVNTPYAFEIGLINSGSASRYQVLLQGENECKNAAAPHPCKLMNRVDCTACHASAPPRLNEGAISPAKWAIAWRRKSGRTESPKLATRSGRLQVQVRCRVPPVLSVVLPRRSARLPQV